MKNDKYPFNYNPDDDDDYNENAWQDACDREELATEDGDDDHWNGDLG